MDFKLVDIIESVLTFLAHKWFWGYVGKIL